MFSEQCGRKSEKAQEPSEGLELAAWRCSPLLLAAVWGCLLPESSASARVLSLYVTASAVAHKQSNKQFVPLNNQ